MVIIPASPPPELYQEAETKFFYTLGACVTRWEHVDRQLFQIYHTLLRTDAERSALLYYKDRTISSRIENVGTILKHFIKDQTVLDEWAKLRARMGALVAIRNIYVHHPTLRTGTSDGEKPVYIYSIHMEPYERVLLNRSFGALDGKEQLVLADLEEHVIAVEQLELDLRTLANKMAL